MSHALDLEAYLRRIGWSGPVRPDLATLRRLAAAHLAAIPFENLNPFLGLPVPLDLAALERKFVAEGRGGYCYEQNLLFSAVLEAIGFAVSGLGARVLWQLPEDSIRSRGHMVLRVEFDGATHIVDVGFGGIGLTGVLQLEANIEQPTAHEPFRLLLPADGDWRMQAKLGGEWRSLYRFDLQRQYQPDYEIANYFVSTHPASGFVTGLMMARAAPERRLSLGGRQFTVRHYPSGRIERRPLQSADEICEVLEREFLIRLPAAPNLKSRLDALP
jgi:N-hydroxyarylamine O-acetyltransferase